MRRINLPLILDTLFFALCTFLLFFTALRFYTGNAVIALVLAISAGLICGALSYFYISRKQNKKLLLSRDERQKKLLALHLSLSSDEYILNVFKGCLGENARVRGKKVFTQDSANYFNFKMQPLSEDDIAAIIKHKFDNKKKLYCTKVSAEAAYLAHNFGIEITDIDGVFKLLKEHDALPEKYLYEGRRVGAFRKIKSRFNRKLSAPLFLSGSALLILSFFTFFPLYYIISGGIMLILSLAAFAVKS